MKPIKKIMLVYFVVVLPLITVAWLIWPAIAATETTRGSWLLEWGNAISGWLFGLWMLCGLVIGVLLIFSEKYREELLKRLVGLKERDEREQMIVGKSARNTFLFNFALLIFLFALNLMTINLTNLPEEKIVDGKKQSLSLGLHFSIFDENNGNKSIDKKEDGAAVFKYTFPFSTSGILLLLITTQLGAFCYYSRKIS